MIGELLALVGAVLVLLSAIGVVRFATCSPDSTPWPRPRRSASCCCSSGAAVNLRDLNDLTSVVLAGVLHLLASPPASNMVSRAAYLAEGSPHGRIDEHPPLTRTSADPE